MKRSVIYNTVLTIVLAAVLALVLVVRFNINDAYLQFAYSHTGIMVIIFLGISLLIAMCIMKTQSCITYILSALLIVPLAFLFTNLYIALYAHPIVAVAYIIKKDTHPLKFVVQLLYICASVLYVGIALSGLLLL